MNTYLWFSERPDELAATRCRMAGSSARPHRAIAGCLPRPRAAVTRSGRGRGAEDACDSATVDEDEIFRLIWRVRVWPCLAADPIWRPQASKGRAFAEASRHLGQPTFGFSFAAVSLFLAVFFFVFLLWFSASSFFTVLTGFQLFCLFVLSFSFFIFLFYFLFLFFFSLLRIYRKSSSCVTNLSMY